MGQNELDSLTTSEQEIVRYLQEQGMSITGRAKVEESLALARVWALLNLEISGPQDEGVGNFDEEFLRQT